MDKALYIAMTGAKHNTLAQTNAANNLANVNTTGFRADFEQARSMPVFYGEGHPTRAYALTENPDTDFRPGPLIETGKDMDVAIHGEGFIVVQGRDGNEAYTRAGDLQVDAAGILRNGKGLPVLGNGGPIALPPFEKIEIGIDGTISLAVEGEAKNAIAEVDRIRLVKPDLANIEKFEDGLLRTRDGTPLQPDPTVELVSGFVEGSNVNAVEEMVDILALARQYEMNVKLMRTTEENSESSARLLQIS